MESEIRYYQRRAREEMAAATRAVTEAARQRRLQLVDLFVQRLEAMKAPSPFGDADPAPPIQTALAVNENRSAFAWPGARQG